MRNECNVGSAMSPMSIHWDRNEFAILDDPERDRSGYDIADFDAEDVVLLRRSRSSADFVQVGMMPRSEARVIIETAQRHDSYAAQVQEADARDRQRAEQLQRGFIPRRYERLGWVRGAVGRERGPKLSLANEAPEDGHTWHAVGMVTDAP